MKIKKEIQGTCNCWCPICQKFIEIVKNEQSYDILIVTMKCGHIEIFNYIN